jgi:hypothetical protein
MGRAASSACSTAASVRGSTSIDKRPAHVILVLDLVLQHFGRVRRAPVHGTAHAGAGGRREEISPDPMSYGRLNHDRTPVEPDPALFGNLQARRLRIRLQIDIVVKSTGGADLWSANVFEMGCPGVPALLLVLAGGVGLFANVVRLISGARRASSHRLQHRGEHFPDALHAGWLLHREPERRAACCSSSAPTSAPHERRGCSGWCRSTRGSLFLLRIRSFESAHLKVNDKEGNPIEIGAIVVWKVIDTAEAAFEVDNYEAYVRVQSESALRNAAPATPTTRTTSPA